MAKEKSKEQQATNGQISDQAEVKSLPVHIHAQYIKDLSFENPNAPETLRGGQEPPKMAINVGMDARKLEGEGPKNLFEVVLNVNATATRGNQVIFIAEVVYGAAVSISDEVPEDKHHPMLFIEIPRHIFPFARQSLADLAVQGGYPPLLLNPVDFHSLYLERFGKDVKKTGGDEKAVADKSKKKESA